MLITELVKIIQANSCMMGSVNFRHTDIRYNVYNIVFFV